VKSGHNSTGRQRTIVFSLPFAASQYVCMTDSMPSTVLRCSGVTRESSSAITAWQTAQTAGVLSAP
jgi:hypothetical protein